MAERVLRWALERLGNKGGIAPRAASEPCGRDLTGGDNSQGQLGDGTTTYLGSVQASGIVGAVAVAGRGDHSLVLTGTSTPVGYGQRRLRPVGTGDRAQQFTRVPGLGGMATLAAGYGHGSAHPQHHVQL